jgi:hypothetical protein
VRVFYRHCLLTAEAALVVILLMALAYWTYSGIMTGWAPFFKLAGQISIDSSPAEKPWIEPYVYAAAPVQVEPSGPPVVP